MAFKGCFSGSGKLFAEVGKSCKTYPAYVLTTIFIYVSTFLSGNFVFITKLRQASADQKE